MMTQPERNTTVNAGPPIEPAPHIGARVAVHAPGYRDSEPGQVVGIQPGYHHCWEVALDSGEGAVFAPEELEAIDVG